MKERERERKGENEKMKTIKKNKECKLNCLVGARMKRFYGTYNSIYLSSDVRAIALKNHILNKRKNLSYYKKIILTGSKIVKSRQRLS